MILDRYDRNQSRQGMRSDPDPKHEDSKQRSQNRSPALLAASPHNGTCAVNA